MTAKQMLVFWLDVIAAFRKRHPETKVLPLETFVSELREYLRDTPHPFLRQYGTLVTETFADQLNTMFRDVPLDISESYIPECPPIDAEWAESLVDDVTEYANRVIITADEAEAVAECAVEGL